MALLRASPFVAEWCSRAAVGNVCICMERPRTVCRSAVKVMFMQVLYFSPQHNQAEDKTGNYIDYFCVLLKLIQHGSHFS